MQNGSEFPSQTTANLHSVHTSPKEVTACSEQKYCINIHYLQLVQKASPCKHALNHIGPVQAVNTVCSKHSLLHRYHSSTTIHHEVPKCK